MSDISKQNFVKVDLVLPSFHIVYDVQGLFIVVNPKDAVIGRSAIVYEGHVKHGL